MAELLLVLTPQQLHLALMVLVVVAVEEHGL
jgi:hypothetical protein